MIRPDFLGVPFVPAPGVFLVITMLKGNLMAIIQQKIKKFPNTRLVPRRRNGPCDVRDARFSPAGGAAVSRHTFNPSTTITVRILEFSSNAGELLYWWTMDAVENENEHDAVGHHDVPRGQHGMMNEPVAIAKKKSAYHD